MSVAGVTIGYGVVLALVGVIAYVTSGGSSITALIPTFIGIPIVLAGVAATRPKFRSNALYFALGLSALMIGGSFRGIIGLFEALTGGRAITTPMLIQLGLVVLAIAFIIVAIRALRPGRGVKA